MSEQKLINAKSPREACQKTGRYLKSLAKELGYNPDNVYVRNPKESENYVGSKAWSVTWEEGPFEWAYNLSGGSSIYAGEFCSYSTPSEIKIWDMPNYIAECQNSFTLLFYKD